MGWRRLSRYIRALEDQGDLIRVTHPVDCYLEAGCIADKLVKNDGPAVIFGNRGWQMEQSLNFL